MAKIKIKVGMGGMDMGGMDEETPMESKSPMEEMDMATSGKKIDPYEVDQAAKTLLDAEKVKADASLYKAALAKVAVGKKHSEAVLGKKKITSIEQLKRASYLAKD